MAPPRLSAVMLAAARAKHVPPAVADEERNILLWPVSTASLDLSTGRIDRSALGLPPLADDELHYASGGPDDEPLGPPRLCALLGPEATLRGLGHILEPIVNAATGGSAVTSLSPETIAKALHVYNRDYLAADSADKWRVGLRLTLPIEIDKRDNAAERWVTRHDKLLEWEAAYVPNALSLETDALRLPLPDPDVLAADATRDLQQIPDARLAAELAAALLENPFAVVFRVVETLAQLRILKDRAGGNERAVARARERAVARSLVASIGQWRAELLGWATAGNAVLRACWRAIRPIADDVEDDDPAATRAARRSVAAALGLIRSGDDTWYDPAHFTVSEAAGGHLARGPGTEPLELRLTRRQAQLTRPLPPAKWPGLRAQEARAGRHEIVLGRDLFIGQRDSYSYERHWLSRNGAQQQGDTTWAGPTTAGYMDPVWHAERYAKHAPDSRWEGLPDTPQFSACSAITLKIAANEGKLDAARAADAALLSTGMQQWSPHSNRELPPLLHRFWYVAPEYFDLFFGLYRLQTKLSGSAGGREAPNPTPEQIRAANPEVDQSTPFGEYMPAFVTLRRVLPNEDPDQVHLAEDDPTLDDAPCALPEPLHLPMEFDNRRLVFFGGRVTGTDVELSGAWCARVRLAALCCPDYGLNQLRFAAFRFRRVVQDLNAAAPPIGVPHFRDRFDEDGFGTGEYAFEPDRPTTANIASGRVGFLTSEATGFYRAADTLNGDFHIGVKWSLSEGWTTTSVALGFQENESRGTVAVEAALGKAGAQVVLRAEGVPASSKKTLAWTKRRPYGAALSVWLWLVRRGGQFTAYFFEQDPDAGASPTLTIGKIEPDAEWVRLAGNALLRATPPNDAPDRLHGDDLTYFTRSPVEELFSSEFAAAAVLDQHINVPGRVRSAIGAAIGRASAATEPYEYDDGAPRLRREWLLRFAVAYLGVRWTASKELRAHTILRQYDGTLSAEPGSFEGWG